MKAPLLIAVSPTVTVHFGCDWLLHKASPDVFFAQAYVPAKGKALPCKGASAPVLVSPTVVIAIGRPGLQNLRGSWPSQNCIS